MIEVEIEEEVFLPVYRPLLAENDFDIEFIYGGRDSGKSKFVAQKLTKESLELDYFRCLLIKQTFESIKDAQWQMIKDVAEEWGVDEFYKFVSSPLSIRQGQNTFAARGMDKPGKIKSFANPSHAWVEEGNQLSKDGFITLLTSLRSDYGKVKMYFTFNPEADTLEFKDFWIYEMFFKGHEGEMSFIGEITTELIIDGVKTSVTLRYRCTHTTYQDNPFVSPQRIAIHESLKHTSPYWYRVYTLGLWGNKENNDPWAYAYDADKHTGLPEADRNFELYLSFDFNRNPACCSVIQNPDFTQLRVIETIKIPKSGTDRLCEYILENYPGFMYIVTGDYSGNTASSLYNEQVTNYTVIRQKLGITEAMIRIEPNPPLAKNQTLVNNILFYFDVIIHQKKAKALHFDLANVKKRADGTILKKDRDDPTQQADALDTLRYYCNKFMKWFTPEVAIAYKKHPHPVPQLPANAPVIAEQGSKVVCTKEEYFGGIREQLTEKAGQFLQAKQGTKAQALLMEINRLDLLFK